VDVGGNLVSECGGLCLQTESPRDQKKKKMRSVEVMRAGVRFELMRYETRAPLVRLRQGRRSRMCERSLRGREKKGARGERGLQRGRGQ